MVITSHHQDVRSKPNTDSSSAAIIKVDSWCSCRTSILMNYAVELNLSIIETLMLLSTRSI